MSLPGALRRAACRSPIGFFLHVPFPAPECWPPCRRHRAAWSGTLLACDLLGFQTDDGPRQLRRDRGRLRRRRRGPTTTASSSAAGGAARRLPGRDRAAGIRRDCRGAGGDRALPAAARASVRGQALMLGVDRLDPTKGLPERLEAFRRGSTPEPAPQRDHAADRRRLARGRAGLSRPAAGVDARPARINSEFGEPDWTPLRLLARPQPRDTVAGFMREARSASSRRSATA